MLTWHILNEEDAPEVYREDQIEDLLDVICDQDYYEDADSFDDYLYNNEGDVEVYGHEFSVSDVLRAMGTYDDDLRYWAEAEADNARDEFKGMLMNMSDNETDWFNNTKILCVEIRPEAQAESEQEEEEAIKKQAEERKAEIQEWSNAFSFSTIP